MNLEKVLYLIRLTKDNSLPLELKKSDVVDFEPNIYVDDETVKNGSTVIIRSKNSEGIIDYIKFEIEVVNSEINITRVKNETDYSFHKLIVNDICNQHLVTLMSNSGYVITYVFSDNILTCDDVNKLSIKMTNNLFYGNYERRKNKGK